MRPSVAVLYPHVPDASARLAGREAGADIAYSLLASGARVVTRRDSPRAEHALDWVFADSVEGVRAARAAGAEILWLTTLPAANHPALGAGAQIVGQPPRLEARAAEYPSLEEGAGDLLFAAFPAEEGAGAFDLSVSRRIGGSFVREEQEEALRGEVLALARALKLRAPFSCGARPNADGKHDLFNLNLNPSLAGGNRRAARGELSLFVTAAEAAGLPYAALLKRVLRGAWRPET